jgi:small GTP-binding protein
MWRMGIFKRKICVIGSFSVGKTSLVNRFVHDRFDEKYLTTVGISVSQKLMPPLQAQKSGPSVQYIFLIWDIAALEKFDSISINYFRGASGALAVADMTRLETIDDLGPLCKKFIEINPKAALVTVGNKADLYKGDKTVRADLNTIASEYNADMLLTSAKSGAGVDDAFIALSQRIRDFDG